MSTEIIALLFIGVPAAIVLLVVFYLLTHWEDWKWTPKEYRDNWAEENRKAGIYGEQVAAEVIKAVLRPSDILLTNVEIACNGKQAEMDHVIINNFGVFIIEVKNYHGNLQGTAEDREWTQIKTTEYGNIYRKEVRNPIPQVKRQIYLLANYLENYGIRVWVDGYVILVQRNAPCESPFILTGPKHIDRVLHSAGKNHLNQKTIDKIAMLLK